MNPKAEHKVFIVANVLYITQDGVTDHIGQAQIAPYLVELGRLGHSIHIVSAEKPGREKACEQYRSTFDSVGIRWTIVRYYNRPALISSFWTMLLLWRAARAVAANERPELVHCRSYLPLGIASRLKHLFGTKYLADFRDFWADVGVETKRFKSVYRWFLKNEGKVLANADHIVTLTNRAASLLIERHSGIAGGDPSNFTVVPCCADFALFNPAQVDRRAVTRRREELRIDPKAPVLVYLGSLGPDYLLQPMMQLFREMRSLEPNAIFLFLVNNGRESVKKEAAQLGIPIEALRFATAERTEIPQYLALATLSPVFIRPNLSKAGCSPTKLAELFAMNVPIIANSGFGDIDEIVDPGRNGSVIIKDFSPASIQSAVSWVLSHRNRSDIREQSYQFSLQEGVARYDRVYRALSENAALKPAGAPRSTC